MWRNWGVLYWEIACRHTRGNKHEVVDDRECFFWCRGCSLQGFVITSES